MEEQYVGIAHYISDLLLGKFNVPESSLIEDSWDKPLTGDGFHFTGADMTYLLFEVEKHYGIKVSDEVLQNYGFSTIRKVCQSIYESLNRNGRDGF